MKAQQDSGTVDAVPLSVAAMEMGLPPAALFQRAVRGEVRITRTGRHWFCERAELDRYAAACSTGATVVAGER